MARTLTLPPRDQIADDVPLRLDVAAALEYPDGSMTASGLRREAARGRLSSSGLRGRITPHGWLSRRCDGNANSAQGGPALATASPPRQTGAHHRPCDLSHPRRRTTLPHRLLCGRS